MTSSTTGRRRLVGVKVVTTRDTPGRLDQLLADEGADVVHVPLIEIGEAPDGGAALADALESLDRFDWVVVTSRHGAARVGGAIPNAVRTAAVGTATAAVLEERTGRRVDLLPSEQRATSLVEAFERVMPDPATRWSVLIAQADRAEPTLAEGLRALGHDVHVHTAYSTHHRVPSADEVALALSADVVAFASGSAAEAWAATIGTRTPPVVCAIGPTTARVARRHGLRVTSEAAVHSVEGLVACVADAAGRIL